MKQRAVRCTKYGVPHYGLTLYVIALLGMILPVEQLTAALLLQRFSEPKIIEKAFCNKKNYDS